MRFLAFLLVAFCIVSPYSAQAQSVIYSETYELAGGSSPWPQLIQQDAIDSAVTDLNSKVTTLSTTAQNMADTLSIALGRPVYFVMVVVKPQTSKAYQVTSPAGWWDAFAWTTIRVDYFTLDAAVSKPSLVQPSLGMN